MALVQSLRLGPRADQDGLFIAAIRLPEVPPRHLLLHHSVRPSAAAPAKLHSW